MREGVKKRGMRGMRGLRRGIFREIVEDDTEGIMRNDNERVKKGESGL